MVGIGTNRSVATHYIALPFTDHWALLFAQNDLITWLLDMAPAENRNVEDITVKLMLINFAAIHTTSLVRTDLVLVVPSSFVLGAYAPNADGGKTAGVCLPWSHSNPHRIDTVQCALRPSSTARVHQAFEGGNGSGHQGSRVYKGCHGSHEEDRQLFQGVQQDGRSRSW